MSGRRLLRTRTLSQSFVMTTAAEFVYIAVVPKLFRIGRGKLSQLIPMQPHRLNQRIALCVWGEGGTRRARQRDENPGRR